MHKVIGYSVSSFLLLAFAAATFSVSIISTNRTINGSQQRLTATKWYSGNMLPDHALYPVRMVIDRVRLETASPTDQVHLRLKYAERRYQAARDLAVKGDIDLATTTLVKSQKYVLDAHYQAVALAPTSSTIEKAEIAAALDHSLYRIRVMQEEFNQVDSPTLTSLHDETAQQLSLLQ